MTIGPKLARREKPISELCHALVNLTSVLGATHKGKLKKNAPSKKDLKIQRKISSVVAASEKIEMKEWSDAAKCSELLLFEKLTEINRSVLNGLAKKEQKELIEQAIEDCLAEFGQYPGDKWQSKRKVKESFSGRLKNIRGLIQSKDEIREFEGPSDAAAQAVAEYCGYTDKSYIWKLKRQGYKAFSTLGENNSFLEGAKLLILGAKERGDITNDEINDLAIFTLKIARL